jgi:hypothetical protein
MDSFVLGRISGIYWNLFTYGFEEITFKEVVLVEGGSFFLMSTYFPIDDT